MTIPARARACHEHIPVGPVRAARDERPPRTPQLRISKHLLKNRRVLLNQVNALLPGDERIQAV